MGTGGDQGLCQALSGGPAGAPPLARTRSSLADALPESKGRQLPCEEPGARAGHSPRRGNTCYPPALTSTMQQGLLLQGTSPHLWAERSFCHRHLVLSRLLPEYRSVLIAGTRGPISIHLQMIRRPAQPESADGWAPMGVRLTSADGPHHSWSCPGTDSWSRLI